MSELNLRCVHPARDTEGDDRLVKSLYDAFRRFTAEFGVKYLLWMVTIPLPSGGRRRPRNTLHPCRFWRHLPVNV